MKARLSWMLSLVVSGTLPAAPLAAAEPNTLSKQEISDGWILLFDGATDFGWKAASKANWTISDGTISVDSGEKGLLCTTSQFGDYVLKADFQSDKGTNSGIFLRTPPQPTDPAKDCYELNIADEGTSPFPTGSFVKREKAAGKHDTTEWQSYEVTARGGHFVVKLDGKVVLDYTDPKPIGRGHIGLQLNSGRVAFRNVKLKPLGLESVFNGKDLTGWHVTPDRKSVFSVTKDGEINVKDGNGELETDGQWADFVLQLDIKSNGKLLNSGIFFRCIPGKFWQGYESQIHNGFNDGNRHDPKDYGTGGIYRRQKARKVVADDFQWFTKTLVATGPHIAVWVNGYQVSDWTDERKPDENPRRGLRLEKGTISIQGHDPTTDLSFRNIRIAETPPQ